MSEEITKSAALVEVLLMHFGVRDPKELLLRPLTFDIKTLTVQCENVNAPFKGTLYTHIQAVSTVDETVLVWLGHKLPMHFRAKEVGFDANLVCNKIYYDRNGLRPIIEGLDEEREMHIHHIMRCSVEIDLSQTINPR